MKWIRWSFVFTYAVLVVLVVGYLLYFINFQAGKSEFSALPLVVLGLPWSVGIPQLAGTNYPPLIVAWLAIVSGIILNGFILRLIGGMIGRVVRGRQRQ